VLSVGGFRWMHRNGAGKTNPMKITAVHACQPVAANSPGDWRTSLGQILVCIDTDAGIRGSGVGGGGLAGIHVVRTVLRDLLLGKDPERIAELWDQMYAATLPFGRKGIAIMAISGVDLALWDIAGRAAKLPVARLLRPGWKPRPIPVYATVWDQIDPELVDQYHAFKLHLGHRGGVDPVSEAVEAVARARSLVGPDRDLMIDAWMKWDVPTTLEVARQTQSCGLRWIEEPLPIDDVAGYVELSGSCPVPIAGGEHEYTARGFQELIDRRIHRILQPDACWCGGLTELVKIYDMAKRAGMKVCPHRGAEVWGLHAMAALDDQPLAESGRPWMTWVIGQPAIVGGMILLDDQPGFGVRIDEIPT
jgi:L-alanine-DL-glutamate epimerase-like enolase superfamily enzyme